MLFSFNVVYAYISIYNAPIYSVYLALNGFLLSYITTLILSILPVAIRKIISIFLILFFALFFIVEFYCIDYLRVPFDADFAMLIFTTNPNEASEFLQSMIPLEFILKIFGIITIVGCITYLISKFAINKWAVVFLLFVVLIASFAGVRNSSTWNHAIWKKVYSVMSYDVPDDLREYFIRPDVEMSSKSPKNIVVIMGESFSKHHSSLYGYEKETNPLLSKLVADSSLIVFENVTSAGLSTMISFKYMMSGYNPDSDDSKEWYEYPLLLDVLKSAKYNTHWISNHANVGVNNNVTRLLAYACDDYCFTDDNVSGDFSTTYDEELINLAKPIIAQYNKQPYNFYFFHLLGSHFRFDLRYPGEYAKFTENDYLDCLEHQRFTLASYDNSIIYNDSVVYEIIQLFNDKEAIILYLSDHGLDLYNSSENYAAHGKINNPISAKFGSEIPLLIYPTELYKQNNSDMVRMLKESKSKPFRTDSLMSYIMHLAKISYK